MDNQLSLVRREVSDISADQQALVRRADDAASRDLAILRGNDSILAEVSRLAMGQLPAYDGTVGMLLWVALKL